MAHIARHAVVLALALAAGCNRPPPEGVYPCTTAAECPVSWVCRADSRCWMHPLPVDAAMLPDAGSTCGAESCNGADDDCDGLIDEGVLTVGLAVPANTTPEYVGALIVPLASGFGIFGTSVSSATAGGWSTLDALGATVVPVSSTQTFVLDATSSGDRAVVTGGSLADAHLGNVGINIFDFATSSQPTSFLPILSASGDPRLPLVDSFDGTRAILYATEVGSMGTALRRTRVDTTVPSIIDDMEVDPKILSMFAVAHASANDYLAYVDASGSLQLFRGWPDDGTTPLVLLGTITSTPGTLSALQLAIRDPHRPISSTNPIVVVWGTSAGEVSVVEITNAANATSFAMTPARTLSGTRGPGIGLFQLHPLAIAPARSASSSAPSHWIVAIVGNDGSSAGLGVVQVFEVTQDAVREITLPDEMYVHRDEVGLAVSNGHIRLSESGNTSGIVTRSIGCE